MSSLIDATLPASGQAYTADVRQNFLTARDEIEALQITVATLSEHQFNHLVRRPGSWHLFNQPTLSPSAVLNVGIRAVYAWPFFAPRDMNLSEVAYRLDTNQGSTLHTAVYSSANANGADFPGDLIYEGGAILCTTLGVKQAPFSLTLEKGALVWIAVMCNGAERIYSISPSNGSGALGWATPTSDLVMCLRATLPSNLMPATMPPMTTSAFSYPAVFYREAQA